MNGTLKDKTYIITGATSGMGRSMAERFGAEGAKIIVSGRDLERGRQVENSINLGLGSALFVPGDVREVAYNQLLVKEAVTSFGALDGIVTNAGMLGLDDITVLPVKKWRDTFATNLDAVYFLLKYAIPVMKERGRGAVVINASIAAWKSFPNHPAYCASKAGLVALAKQVAVQHGPEIRVNTICPGPVDTPLIWNSAQAFPDPKRAVQDAADATLMKRLGRPEDIAGLALFLISDASSWITGSSFTIDGGISAKG